jgi:hypothetical protein
MPDLFSHDDHSARLRPNVPPALRIRKRSAGKGVERHPLVKRGRLLRRAIVPNRSATNHAWLRAAFVQWCGAMNVNEAIDRTVVRHRARSSTLA